MPEELVGRVPTLKVIPQLPNSNPNGDIFGGWILSQMDLAGASRAYQYVGGRIVTVGVEAISFHKPVFLGDQVSFYTKVFKLGQTSITIKIESWALRHTFGRNYEYIKVTEGLYTYVHIDENRKPSKISR
ncbi:MAG: acyl-CoA thioesterase [Micavibrio aeruginosavorus]|uniref:Acyl-CoA thioesterase n=1 Tax=Micavibrio aeruginosavorus TaxID=349221 RepID=A0A2W5N1E5_9BACT|nr:MAG: acyl-CoA thioesterase [Micavibrio aeruginosavorus]